MAEALINVRVMLPAGLRDDVCVVIDGGRIRAVSSSPPPDARIVDCGGKLLLVHEGGYSEAHVPFCGHAVIATLAGSSIAAPDPFSPRLAYQQPNARLERWQKEIIDEIADAVPRG